MGNALSFTPLKILTFKSLAISKFIYVSYITSVPSDIIHTCDHLKKFRLGW